LFIKQLNHFIRGISPVTPGQNYFDRSGARRIVTVVNRYKNNNEEYVKIKKTVEAKVSSVLTDGKVLLQLALASIIEA
jgi:hypothetical protein